MVINAAQTVIVNAALCGALGGVQRRNIKQQDNDAKLVFSHCCFDITSKLLDMKLNLSGSPFLYT